MLTGRAPFEVQVRAAHGDEPRSVNGWPRLSTVATFYVPDGFPPLKVRLAQAYSAAFARAEAESKSFPLVRLRRDGRTLARWQNGVQL